MPPLAGESDEGTKDLRPDEYEPSTCLPHARILRRDATHGGRLSDCSLRHQPPLGRADLPAEHDTRAAMRDQENPRSVSGTRSMGE